MDNIESFKMMCDKSTTTDRQVPGSAIFFDKNKQFKQGFRKRFMTIKKEKSTLEDAISYKNTEIEDLKRSVQSLNEVINSATLSDFKSNSNIAQSKIIELNKKNRSLSTELENSRAKNSSLEMKLHKLETELKRIEESKKNASQKISDDALEDLTTKLNQTKQKLFESLNLNVELKNQLKLAQKCIQQEIGESVNLNTLASAGTSWRGRAQTIMSLQIKINDLKEQLGAARNESTWAEECLEEPPIRREQIYHRAEVEVLQKDISKHTAFIEELNQKIAALKARNNNLTVDMAKLKEKCSNADAAANKHDKAVEALNEQLRTQKLFYENKMRDLQKEVNRAHSDRSNFEFQQDELKIRLENLQATLKNKETQIENLNETVKKLEKDLRSICGDFLFDCRDFRKEEFVGMLDSLESEKGHLLELNKLINERLEVERNKGLNLNDQISKQKVQIYRLEAKIRELEKKMDNQTEKKRRSHRITEYANSINTKNSVSSFVFENSSFTDVSSYNEDINQPDVLDLKNKLEIAHEKIALLEDKLSYLTEEKQNDAKTFQNIIKSSRSVFLEATNKMKLLSSPSSSVALVQ